MVVINSKNQNKKRKISLSKINKVAEKVLKVLGQRNIELNIVFLSNQKIRVFNRTFLGIDTATDVIAFPADDAGNSKKRKSLGDIAISSDKAVQNAKIYKVSFLDEISLYLIHGILHFMGYDDKNVKSRKIMQKKENELLQKVRPFLRQRVSS